MKRLGVALVVVFCLSVAHARGGGHAAGHAHGEGHVTAREEKSSWPRAYRSHAIAPASSASGVGADSAPPTQLDVTGFAVIFAFIVAIAWAVAM